MLTLATIRNALLPPENILQANPEDTLDAALSKTASTHDAVFVFDKEGKFLGLISPSYALFRKRYPYTTKIKTCLIHPPHIGLHTPLFQVAEFMVMTGMYTLPAFAQDGSLAGIITARRMLKFLSRDSEFLSRVLPYIKPEKPVIASIHESIKNVYKLLREKQISRVVLVDENRRLQGIVSRRDIQLRFTKPTTWQRTRIGKKGHMRDYAFGKEKESRLEGPVASVAQKTVLAVPSTTQTGKVVKELLRSERNSIVLLDQHNRPTGIISIRIILQALAALKPGAEIPISVTNDTKLFSTDIEALKDHLYNELGSKLTKRSPIQRIELHIKEVKNSSARPIVFEITLLTILFSGKTLVATVQDRDYKNAVHEAIRRIRKQERRP